MFLMFRLNLTFSTMIVCWNITAGSIMESCSSRAVLGKYNEMIMERFTPWTDTIYDKLLYTKRVIEHASQMCNSGLYGLGWVPIRF